MAGCVVPRTSPETKVQNLSNQTALSAQGQSALSKGFCSLPGSPIHWKWPFARAHAYAASFRLCVRVHVRLCERKVKKSAFCHLCDPFCRLQRRLTARGRWPSRWIFMWTETRLNLWMKLLSQIKLCCEVGRQSGRGLAAREGCCQSEFTGFMTESSPLSDHPPPPSSSILLLIFPADWILKSDLASASLLNESPRISCSEQETQGKQRVWEGKTDSDLFTTSDEVF